MTDAISRQAAIDAIRDMQAFEDDNGQPYLYLYDVMAVFTDEEELPSIQPNKGKWKKNGYCSECGTKAPYWEWSLFWYESNFCPNCGADMRGEHQ